MKNVINRIKYIYHHYGRRRLTGLILMFLAQRLVSREQYYLLEKNIPAKLEEKHYLPRLPDYACEIVATIDEADKLVARGCAFYSTSLNTRERLRKGAIACCMLVGTDIAHIGWIALSEEAKNTWNPYPYRVDFQHGEACSGGAVTLPKYEGKGLMTYGLYRRLELLREKGIKKSHTFTAVNNTGSLKAQSKLAYEKYARVDYAKILWWHHWKETPIHEHTTGVCQR